MFCYWGIKPSFRSTSGLGLAGTDLQSFPTALRGPGVPSRDLPLRGNGLSRDKQDLFPVLPLSGNLQRDFWVWEALATGLQSSKVFKCVLNTGTHLAPLNFNLVFMCSILCVGPGGSPLGQRSYRQQGFEGESYEKRFPLIHHFSLKVALRQRECLAANKLLYSGAPKKSDFVQY